MEEAKNEIWSARFFYFEDLFCDDTTYLEVRAAMRARPGAGRGKLEKRLMGAQGAARAVYRFDLTAKKPRWVKKLAGHVAQRAFAERDGSYALVTYGADQRPIKKESYSSAHAWRGVEYFAPGGERCGAVFIADGGRLNAEQALSDGPGVRSLELLPFPALRADDPAVYARVTRSAGIPALAAYTAGGVVFYFTDACAQKAAACLEEPPQREPAADEAEKTQARKGARGYYAVGTLRGGAQTKASRHGVEETPPVDAPSAPVGEASKKSREPVCLPVREGDGYTLQPHREGQKQGLGIHFSMVGRQATVTEWEKGTARGALCVQEGGLLTCAQGWKQDGPEPGIFLREADLMREFALFEGPGETCLRIEHDDNGNLYALLGAEPGAAAAGARFTAGGAVAVSSWKGGLPADTVAVFDGSGALTYSGQIREDAREGYGISRSPDGSLYVGQWKNDQPEGRGAQFDQRGALRYYGDFAGGKRCGHGIEYQEDCSIRYDGGWAEGLYSGRGERRTEEGRTIVGQFQGGLVSGRAEEYGPDGEKLFEGEWKEGERCGQGALYLPDGGRIEGYFEGEAPLGEASHFGPGGELCYRGTFSGASYEGHGVLYENGRKRYEGRFASGEFSGPGRLYDETGKLLYAGNFTAGRREGIGASFKGEKPLYFGQWSGGAPEGCGIAYEDGMPRFVGQFSAGRPHGRADEYRNGRLVVSGIFDHGKLLYMAEFTTAGLPCYIGGARGRQRCGMGRLLGGYCEGAGSGVFSAGRLLKPMRVNLQRLQPLPCPEALLNTVYERFARPEAYYVFDEAWKGGVYSGRMKKGQPDGTGTLLCSHHRYSGAWREGKPCGEGRLFLPDGRLISGVFGGAGTAVQAVECDGFSYYFSGARVTPANGESLFPPLRRLLGNFDEPKPK